MSSISASNVLIASTAPKASVPTSRSVQDAASEVFDVKNFGAVGDGSGPTLNSRFATLSDAQAVYPRAADLGDSLEAQAILAALDAAHAAGGGVVRIPRGTYKLNGHGIDLTGNSVRLVGDGIDATVLDIANSSGACISTSSVGYYNGIEELTVTCSTSRGGDPLISFADERRHLMRRVKLSGHVNGIQWSRFEVCTMLECYIDNPSTSAGGNAITLGVNDGVQRGANISIIDCFLRGMNSVTMDAPRGTIGLLAYDVDAIFMVNTDISGFTDHSVFIAPQKRGQNHHFLQSFFDATANGHTFYVAGAGTHTQWQFTGCWFAGAGRARAAGAPEPAAGSSDGSGFYLENQGVVQDLNFTGCRFFLNSGVGMMVAHPQADINLTGSTFFQNGFVSNVFKHGLWINPASNQSVGMNISGCKFSNNAASDVMAESTAQFNVISGCKMESGGLGWVYSGRFQFADVRGVVDPSSTNLTVGSDSHMVIPITIDRGNVTSINSANFSYLKPTFPGHIVSLLFYGSCRALDNASGGNLQLTNNAGGLVAGTVLTLICWDDGNWREINRTTT